MPWTNPFGKSVSQQKLRNFGWILTGILGLISGILFYQENNVFVHFFLAAIICGCLTAFLPIALKPIYEFLTAVSRGINTLMTIILLSMVFFLGIGIISTILNCLRKKTLLKKSDPNSLTYWIKRSEIKSPKVKLESQF
jgi:hypothetical protein